MVEGAQRRVPTSRLRVRSRRGAHKKTPSPPGRAEREPGLRLTGTCLHHWRGSGGHRHRGALRRTLGLLRGLLGRLLLRRLLGGLLRSLLHRLLGGLLGGLALGGGLLGRLLRCLPYGLLCSLLRGLLGRLALGDLAGCLLRGLLGGFLCCRFLDSLLRRLLGGLLRSFLHGHVMAPRQLTFGYYSPVQNSITGIGPATNRRRAGRAGTDSVHRKRVLPATKNPRRVALRVSDSEGVCVFAKETMPASTVETVRAEGFVVLRDVVVIDLTRFCRDASAGRNLITVFSTVNSPA